MLSRSSATASASTGTVIASTSPARRRSTACSSFAEGWSLTTGDFVQPQSFGFAYSFTGGFAWWVSPAGSTPHNVWHHVAATFAEGDTAPALYVEGVAQVLTVDAVITGAPAITAGLDVASAVAPWATTATTPA